MDQTLELLSSGPGYEELVRGLQLWTSEPVISKLSTKAALVTRAIVLEILPNFWPLAEEDAKLRILLLKSLSSLAGINALISRRDDLICRAVLQILLESGLLSPNVVYREWFTSKPTTPTLLQQSKQLWSQYVALVCGSKILNLMAEVTNLELGKSSSETFWLDDRRKFSTFLGKEFAELIIRADDVLLGDMSQCAALYLERSVSLGDSDLFLETVMSKIKISDTTLSKLCAIVVRCGSTVQARFIHDLLKYMEKTFLPNTTDARNTKNFSADSDRVGAAARVLLSFVSGSLLSSLCNSLLERSNGHNIALRRAIILALPSGSRYSIARECIDQWADQLYIRHASTIVQECLTESILLLCAYLPIQELTAVSKSRALMEGISNRLESTSDRIRFLGMILGEAISAQVIADEKKRLTFGVPDTQAEEAQWWKSLIEIEDTVCDFDQLHAGTVEQPDDDNDGGISNLNSKTDQLEISEMIKDDYVVSSDDEDEFPPMRVPDSDDEDSDEDPTLVDREKLRPPVYIRDLIKMINNHESFKHVSMALHTAPALIRRKASYGSELTDYAITLVQIFAGLRDNFDMDSFQEMRQEALKALVVACPRIACPYLAETFFTGDYSLQQRTMMLAAIGLGSRELAGALETSLQYQNLSVSKTLPASVQKRYEAIADIAAAVEEDILKPLANQAAESLSGPAALKVQKTTRRHRTPAAIKVENRLTPIVGECILFPLLGHFQIHAGKMIDRDASTFYETNLLAYYIKTIALVFQCSFKSPVLARLTTEVWDFLLSLQSQDDRGVLEAILFAFLVMIDTQDERVLATSHARALVETQEWCTVVFERISEQKIQMLAAGILIRIRDVVDHHQLLMMQSITSSNNIGRGRLGIAGL